MLRTLLLEHGELYAENDKLRLLVQRLLRHQFGRRSEQLSPDQLQLGLEDLEQTIAANQAGQEASAGATRKPRSGPAARNHGALPAHLPCYEVVIDVENRDCPCCGRALVPIGEISTEQLDIVLGVQLAMLEQERAQHLLEDRGVVRQGIGIDRHEADAER